eukprot:Opistho-1_new@76201
MKYLKQTALIISFSIYLWSCKTNKIIADNDKTINDVNLYIAGYEYNGSKFERSVEEMANEIGMKHVVKLWKNGNHIGLEGTNQYTDASAVFVNSKDVYVVGSVRPKDNYLASLWKNGKLQTLTDGKKTAHTNALFIEDNNVYVLGEQFGDQHYAVKGWKNGVSTTLTDGKSDVDANSIFVQKGDVYICGSEHNGNKNVAK